MLSLQASDAPRTRPSNQRMECNRRHTYPAKERKEKTKKNEVRRYDLCAVSKPCSIRAQVVSKHPAADQYKHISLCGL